MNADLGNPALLSRSTGFVKTMLCKINASTLAITKRDLNLDTAGGNGAVPKGMSLAHCTDVALFRGQKVCVVAFNSDRFAIINTSNASPGLWSFERTNITASNDDDGSLTGVNVAGPRAIAVALDPNAPTGNQTQPGDRIYIYNRLDHSISVIDPNLTPAARQVFGFAMPNDPVPDYVRRGQQFLYSASLGSASGFVSCASCHIDARSDQLQWRLSSEDTNLPESIHAPLGIGVENHEIPGTTACIDDELDTSDGDGDGFPSKLADDRSAPLDPSTSATCQSPQTVTANAKGPMITQSLQGLLNFEVATGTSLVTNAPYHWRGDKPDFDSFNEAFVNLQGLPDVDPRPDFTAGLSAEEMADYTVFINSIHYPPNPLQPRTRVYAGNPWNLDPLSNGPDLLNPENADAGSGTLLGMKLFHILPTPGLRPISCVGCHNLPDGSNNRLSFIRLAELDGANLYPADVKFQPIESAALRGLTQKEGRLALDAEIPMTQVPATQGTDLRTGDLGTGHDGLEGMTRNDFLVVVINNIGLNHGVPGFLLLKEGIDAINDFVRRIDHGVAPMVGRSMSLSYPELLGQPQFSQFKLDLLEDMEEQVEAANSGLAVYARLNGVERWFWYDLTSVGPGLEPEYQESPPSGSTLSRSELIGLMAPSGNDLLVFFATPLGSDLRVASAFGVPETLAGSDVMPSSFDMVETRPNSAYRLIPTLTANLPDADNGHHGLPDPTPLDPPFVEMAPNLGDFRSLDSFDVLQRSFQFGDDNQNFHDPSRRFRVTATDLVPGARIRLHVPDASGSIEVLEMPIYPTSEFLAGGERIWETAVELDALNVYVLRLGGFNVPEVRDVLDGSSLDEFYVVSSTYDWEFSNSGSAWSSGQAKFKYSLAIP